MNNAFKDEFANTASILNSITIATILTDETGKIIFLNKAAEKFFENFNLKSNEYCLFNICPFNCSKPLAKDCLLKHSLKEREPVTKDICHNGSYYRITGTAIFNDKGEFLYFSESIINIDDLVRERELFKLAIDASDVLIWKYSVKDDEFYNVKGVCFNEEHLSLKQLYTYFAPDDLEAVKTEIDKLLSGKINSSSITFRSKFDAKNIRHKWSFFKTHIVSMRDSAGKVIELLGA